nr:hypothetical protein [uncultured Ruminococcus sp.]
MFDILVNNADSTMTEQEIEELFYQYEKECETELNNLTDRVKNGESKEAVTDEIEEKCENKAVASFIIKRMNRDLKPFEDTRFIRAMKFEDFQKKMTYIFDNTVFHSETKDTINMYLGLEENKIERLIKLANTIVHYYMIKRYTQNCFSVVLRDSFNFKKSWIEFLWHYCEENEEQMKTVITMRCYEMLLKTEKSINNIYRVFSSMLDEENDEQ